MSFPNIYPQGLGYSLGDSLLLQAALYTSGALYYVDNSDPSASDSNAGTLEKKPLATLTYALSIAAAGSIIVIGEGHDETLAASSSVATARLTLVGAGSSGGDPTATIRFGADRLTFSGADFQLRNVKLAGTAVSLTGPMVTISGDNPLLKNVLVEGTAACDGYYAIDVTAAVNRARYQEVKGVSVVDEVGALPMGALRDRAQVRSDLVGCVFDNGAYGFGDAALYVDSGASKQVYIEDLSRLRGADVRVLSANVGWIGTGAASGQALTAI